MALNRNVRWCRQVILIGLVLTVAAPRLSAAAPLAAKVIVASGEAYAIDQQSHRRALRRRSKIFVGDTVGTGDTGRAQLRFTDGSILALRANSQLRIDDYAFDSKAPAKGRSISTLIKGGFRTITGIIGKQAPDAYRVNSQVASIGVRGTNYEAVLAGTLAVGAWKGRVSISNKAGTLYIGEGAAFNFAQVQGPDHIPSGLLTPPAALQGRLPSPAAQQQTNQAPSETSTEIRQLGATEKSWGDSGNISTDPIAMSIGGTLIEDATLLSAIATAGDDSGVTSTEAVTFVEPEFAPNPTTDTVSTAVSNDPRLSALENQRLTDDGRIGMMILSGPPPKSFPGLMGALTGGRATAADLGPIITVPDADPASNTFNEFVSADILQVYHPGLAPQLPPPMPVPAAPGYSIEWGAWDATPGNPVTAQTDVADPSAASLVGNPVLWATVAPAAISTLDARSGVVNFSHVVAAFGHGSGGMGGNAIVTSDFTFSADINFNTGAVTSGLIEIGQSSSLFPEHWIVNFSGSLNGPILAVEPADISGNVIGGFGSDTVSGELGGIVTGPSANAVGGGFSFAADSTPGVHAEGMFLVTE